MSAGTDTSGGHRFANLALALSVGLLVCLYQLQDLRAQDAAKRHHALSLIGEPTYGADFKHFNWVNPDAPKGGSVTLNTIGNFNSLNPFTIQGLSAANISSLTYDQLMVGNLDVESEQYGLVAEWVSYPDDYSSVTFGLRPQARFHDGKPVTPEDVIFSLTALKKANIRYAKYYKNVVKGEKTSEHEVTFTFDSKGNRELPQILGQLYVLPKHYWDAKGPNGKDRDLSKTTTEVPLSSGPYRVKSFDIGKTIVYERVDDYWAKDLPANRGQWNFDEIKFVYFLDFTPALEEFKSGKADYWVEFRSNVWATQFNFDAIKSGKINKEEVPVKRVAPMQAFAFNTRLEKFKDARVRQAFNYAFDFETLNQNMLYNQYIRAESYFGNSELQATGLPEGRELEILNEVKSDVPPEVFTTEYKNPVGGQENMRANLRKATELLKAAGWTVSDQVVNDPDCGFFCGLLQSVGLSSAKSERVLRNKDGKPFEVEFLVGQPAFERIILPYIEDLKKLGIRSTLRTVDSTQYEQRERSFNFEIIVENFGQSLSPGNEQRDYWGSDAAKVEGSSNTIGIQSKAIDRLIDKIVFATDRADLVAATKALDRVLLWSHFVVPQWHYPFERIAYWNKFGRPDKLPSLTAGFLQTWWVDKEKAAALQSAGR